MDSRASHRGFPFLRWLQVRAPAHGALGGDRGLALRPARLADLHLRLQVTESARTRTYILGSEVQKTCQFWLSTFWLLTIPSPTIQRQKVSSAPTLSVLCEVRDHAGVLGAQQVLGARRHAGAHKFMKFRTRDISFFFHFSTVHFFNFHSTFEKLRVLIHFKISAFSRFYRRQLRDHAGILGAQQVLGVRRHAGGSRA